MSHIVERTTIMTPKFEPPKDPAYSSLYCATSIGTWIVLAAAGQYFHGQLADPCTAFQLLQEPPRQRFWLRQHQVPTCLQGSKGAWSDQAKCLLPGVLYDTNDFTYAACQDNAAALWTLLPFRAAMMIAVVSAVFELYVMLVIGHQFCLDITASTSSIKAFRNMLFSVLETAAINATLVLTVGPENAILDFALLYGVFFGVAALAPVLYFDKVTSAPLILAVTEAILSTIVMSRGTMDGSSVTATMLVVASLLRTVAIVVGRPTPSRSTISNTMYTGSFLCLYFAIAMVGNYDGTFPMSVQSYTFPPQYHNLVWVLCVLESGLGFGFTMLISNKTYQAFRSMVSYFCWSLVYLGFMAKPLLRFNPYKLSEVYRDTPPHKIQIHPYTQEHIKGMPKVLAIPSIADKALPQTVTIFSNLTTFVSKAFDIITWIDVIFPQTIVSTPLRAKERFKVWETGHRYYPSSLFSTRPQFPVMGKKLQDAPAPMVEAHKQGDLLPYLCQYGFGNRFLKRAIPKDEYPYFDSESPAGKAGVFMVLDFRYLEHYENKEDYEPYGGVAFFRIESTPHGNKLKLEWVVEPRTIIKTTTGLKNGTYRRVESMIVASLYFSVVAGKHLAEIHMSYNLLEVALHNAFDYGLNTNPREELNCHPIRLILYIHLFSHSLATELTVRHLIQEGAVFNQIFALKYDSLLNFLQQTYTGFVYASDEDFEERQRAMEKLRETQPPSTSAGKPTLDFVCSLDWELTYNDIFVKYADSLVEVIYKDDAHVQNDVQLQQFYESLDTLFETIPDRYDAFQSKTGIKRFLSDTINHMVVGHEFYGTTGVSGAVDPRVILTQVPKDGGPTGVDEWRSLAFVTLATAYVDFCPLLQDPDNAIPDKKRDLETVFDDATPVKLEGDARDKNPDETAAKLQSQMKDAFQVMQVKLRALNDQWEYTGTGKIAEADLNYQYFRPLPKDLTTGPGY